MEDVKFERSHSQSPLPEAGNDPGDPLRPEIDEENSTPNPPITDPHQDMEVTEPDETGRLPDQDDLEEAGLSDNESALSEVDEAQFEDFDVGQIAVEERPAQVIDDTNLNLIGVHKRKRAEGEGEAPKKKKKKADRPRRKKNRDEDAGEAEDAGDRKSRRSRKTGRTRGASPEDDEENLPEDERAYPYPSPSPSHANSCLQGGGAPWIVPSRRPSRVPRAKGRAKTQARTLKSCRMTRSKICAAGWPKPPKPTTTDASAASRPVTNSNFSQKSWHF
jgi:hypothetical protein